MKQAMSFRLLCLIVAALMVLCVFAACVKGGEGDETESADGAVGDVTTAEETQDPTVDKNGYILDTIPDSLDYGGKTVTMLTWADVEHEEFVAASDRRSSERRDIYA
jgi:ABC-type oligopeptide transport system substrate-binding subunit